MIKESTLEFLKNLEENNTREWFESNRKLYEASKANFVDFCSVILEEMKLFEPDFSNTQVKDCIFRINRDVRFSKIKVHTKTIYLQHLVPGDVIPAKLIITYNYKMEKLPSVVVCGNLRLEIWLSLGRKSITLLKLLKV